MINIIGRKLTGRRSRNKDMDELLKKLDGFLEDTVSADDFEAELNKLSSEDKTKFYQGITPEKQAALAKKSEELVGKITALRKEGKRLEDKKTPPAGGEGEGTDYAKQLRTENVGKAFDRFFKDFEISAEQQQLYKDLFAQNDKNHVDVELIYKNLESIYASQNSGELLKLRERVKNMERDGEEFNAQGAGNHGGAGDGGQGGKKFPKEVHDWVAESRRQGIDISLEQAERVLNNGLSRRY